MADNVDAAKVRALFSQLQMTCAGHPLDVVMAALCDSMASVVGVACETQWQADSMLAALAKDMSESVHSNWKYLREVRAQMVGGGNG